MKFKKYPDDYNPILEYNSKIQSGEIVACEKIKKTFQKIVHDIENPNEFFYSQKRANHVLEFFENFCHHSKGKMGGKLVELELWEKAVLSTIFGFINIEGVRKYQRAVLIVGKKNGKSLLASGVGLYLQIADGESGAEVYAVATKKDQAKIIWLEAKKMVKKSPTLLKKIKPLVAELNSDFNDSVFKPLSSDSDTLDGLNVHGALLDEIHQWKNGKELYDIITDGITAREQPLVFITSTAGTVREDIYDTIYDEGKRTINGYFKDLVEHAKKYVDAATNGGVTANVSDKVEEVTNKTESAAEKYTTKQLSSSSMNSNTLILVGISVLAVIGGTVLVLKRANSARRKKQCRGFRGRL